MEEIDSGIDAIFYMYSRFNNYDKTQLFKFVPLLRNNLKIVKVVALAGVSQQIECHPVNQRVAGLIPSQGTCLGCGPGPQ